MSGQNKLIENYDSLLRQLEKEDINVNMSNVIRFCSLFQSDDIELFKKFDLICRGSDNGAYGELSYDNIMGVFDLVIRRYGLGGCLDAEKRALSEFVKKAINEGFSYHLGSSANFDSIMERGLGIEAIGLTTEEREDWKRLRDKSFISGGSLITFSDDNESNLWYSNMPILRARYGIMPEWLIELKFKKLDGDTDDCRLARSILQKYSEKYNGAHRMLFLFPFQSGKIIEKALEKRLESGQKPRDIFLKYWRGLLEQKNLSTSCHISPSSILAIDLEDYSMWMCDEDGKVIKVVNGKSSNNLNK